MSYPIGLFLQKSPVVSDSFAERDLQDKASYGFSAPCSSLDLSLLVSVSLSLFLFEYSQHRDLSQSQVRGSSMIKLSFLLQRR